MVHALGACFCDNEIHVEYYHAAEKLLEDVIGFDCMQHVVILLLISIYMLGLNRTNRSWNALGLAIRIAQSNALHYASKSYENKTPLEIQTMRSTWWALYTFDKCISLQLGRICMVSTRDNDMDLPMEVDDKYICEGAEIPAQQPDDVHCRTTAFICVIRFSAFIEATILALRPTQVHFFESFQDLRPKLCAIDAEVVSWKNNLPHHLRFDLAHVFEKEDFLRYQRNYLGVKYHQLRTLLHRPCLCTGTLNPTAVLSPADDEFIRYGEQVCITESKEMSFMLHNVRSPTQLYREYPWWQMLSCIMCASSILVIVATLDPVRADIESIRHELQLCLSVLQALQDNPGADRCVSMIKYLQEIADRAPQAAPLDVLHHLNFPYSEASYDWDPYDWTAPYFAGVDHDDLVTSFL